MKPPRDRGAQPARLQHSLQMLLLEGVWARWEQCQQLCSSRYRAGLSRPALMGVGVALKALCAQGRLRFTAIRGPNV